MILTKSQSKYLLNIYKLLENKDSIKAIELVKTLNVTRSSCHNMLEILSDLGLVNIEDRNITLTSEGNLTALIYKDYYNKLYKILSKNITGNINESIYVLIESLSQEQLNTLC